MFSVIIYGRNDSHGYNLHKRAAISFNALAEVMSDPDDEILFVDYNTPDDHPTFPEAIQDTLTDKAKKVMRILRVRPEQHAQMGLKTHLVALESQSRNIALRRSNPRNRWILYTNTDMLLVSRDPSQSLSQILGDVPDGFYQIPRFELPEDVEGGADTATGCRAASPCASTVRFLRTIATMISEKAAAGPRSNWPRPCCAPPTRRPATG